MNISPVLVLIILTCLALSLLAPFLKRLSEPPFKQCPLLNKGEVRLMAALERAVPMVFGPDARVCPQVSYGEFLSCSKFSKFARMNCRRADFVVTTSYDHVVLVVELQGSGHYGTSYKSTEKARRADKTKRAALNDAKIPLLEVGEKSSVESLTAEIRERVGTHQGEQNGPV